MATIQSSLAVFSVIEAILRQALTENRPRTTREVFENPDVKRLASGIQQVRDAISSLRQKGVITKHEMRKYGDQYKTSDVGWMWNDGATLSIGKKAPTQPSKPIITKPVQNSDDEIELVFRQRVIVVGLNRLTGRTRIIIEE